MAFDRVNIHVRRNVYKATNGMYRSSTFSNEPTGFMFRDETEGA